MVVDQNLLTEAYIAEYGSWEALAKQIQGEELDPDLRASALRAIPRMAAHLGRQWPADAIDTGHALLEIFFNHAPWTRAYLCEVADAMDAVSSLAGWDALQGRIRLPHDPGAALFELDLAYRALHQDLQVTLQPSTRGKRTVDLAISPRIGVPATLYVEATRLRRPTRVELKAQAIMDQVFPSVALMGWKLQAGGRFLRTPTSEEVAELVGQIKRFWQERHLTRVAAGFVVPGLIEVWGADQNDEQARDDFVSRGYPEPGRFSGPPILVDPFERILQRIREKIDRQLPSLCAGMLVLEPPWPLVFTSPETMCQAFEPVLRAYPQINAMALMRRLPTPEEPVHRVRDLVGGHLCISSPRYLIYTEEVILVRNPNRVYIDADRVIDRLLS